MRRVNQAGIDLIKKYESFSATTYICPAGYPTIGYGHLVKNNEKFTHLSIEEAEELLRKDLAIAEQAVLKHISVPLNDNQFAALVSFVFNLGGGALYSSTLRRKLNQGLYDEVPEQFMRWVYAGGRKLNGLIRRRKEEGELFATPIEKTQEEMINEEIESIKNKFENGKKIFFSNKYFIPSFFYGKTK